MTESRGGCNMGGLEIKAIGDHGGRLDVPHDWQFNISQSIMQR